MSKRGALELGERCRDKLSQHLIAGFTPLLLDLGQRQRVFSAGEASGGGETGRSPTPATDAQRGLSPAPTESTQSADR